MHFHTNRLYSNECKSLNHFHCKQFKNLNKKFELESILSSEEIVFIFLNFFFFQISRFKPNTIIKKTPY